jgi:signal peptide peptidase SppA
MWEPAFRTFLSVVEMRCAGVLLSREEKDRRISEAQSLPIHAEAQQASTTQAPQQIRVLSMNGTICPRMSYLSDMSEEGTSLQIFGAEYTRAMKDSNVAGIMVMIDSPGGNVFQVEETADLIYSYRDTKPNVGVICGMSASAGLWLPSQFRELVACPSADIGSIGVLMRLQDMSKMAEMSGVKVTYVEAPRGGYKSEGNPFTPPGDETIEHYTSRCEEYYDSFIKGLARGRGTKPKTVDRDWGRGRMMGAKSALSLGIVDRIGTVQSEMERMMAQVSKKGRGGMRAAEERVPVLAEGQVEVETPTADLAPEQAVPDNNARNLAISRLRLVAERKG